MRCCLVVTTHERPDALARVLASVAAQTRAPDELVVADDGSGPATAELVDRAARRLPCQVRHAWQPHQGFRAGRIRNVAIAGTGCDYVLLLDGDMVVHPAFVADHLALARRGHYSQGVRILLDAPATARLLDPDAALPGPLAPGLGGLRRSYAMHAPAARRCSSRRSPGTWPTLRPRARRRTRTGRAGRRRSAPAAGAAPRASTGTSPGEDRDFHVWSGRHPVAISDACPSHRRHHEHR